MTNNANVSTKVMGWCVTGVAIYIVSGIMISRYLRSTETEFVWQVGKVINVSQPPEMIINRHLDWADRESDSDIIGAVQAVPIFMRQARQRTRQFAEEALSFSSKWKFITDIVTRDAQHATFLKERFEAIVFSSDDLNEAVESVVNSYIRYLRNTETEMLLRMKADLADLPEIGLPDWYDQKTVASQLDAALRDAATAVQTDLQANAGIEIASCIAGEVLTQATLQLATSSGILGTGAVSGPASLGISLIVGIVVDQIISEVYNQAFDPAGELSSSLNWRLADLQKSIVFGTRESPGLSPRLFLFAKDRNTVRRQAIYDAVFPDRRRSSPDQ